MTSTEGVGGEFIGESVSSNMVCRTGVSSFTAEVRSEKLKLNSFNDSATPIQIYIYF